MFSYDECVQTVVEKNLDLGICLNGSRWRHHEPSKTARTKRSLPGFCNEPCHRERMAYPIRLVKKYIEIKYGIRVDYVLPEYFGKSKRCFG